MSMGELYDPGSNFWAELKSMPENIAAAMAPTGTPPTEALPPGTQDMNAVERWQKMALYGGTGFVAVGAALFLLTEKGKGWGGWLSGLGGGLLAAGFAFPTKAVSTL